MHFRVKTYLQSPIGIWHRLRRDVPYFLRGTTYYESCRLKAHEPQLPHPNRDVVEKYLTMQHQRTASTVVYTCVTNEYDDMSRIACPTAVDFEADYVCFTDCNRDIAAERIGIWTIRPLVFYKLDSTRNNRWHKMHPHLLFPEYEKSIYMDANINVLDSSFLVDIKASRRGMAMPKHPLRDCIFDEYANAFAEFIDSPSAMQRELRMIRKSGMPRHYGLTENNIMFRKHHDAEIIRIMEECWSVITEYSRRDQLCFSWILWKHGIPMDSVSFPHWFNAPRTYCAFPHQVSLQTS